MSDSLPYTVRPISGKGLGVVATRPLSPGDTVMTERALFSVSHAHRRAGLPLTDMLPESKVDRRLFFDLSRGKHSLDNIEHQSEEDIVAIIETNCIEAGGFSMVFNDIERINHSCQPNACWYFHEGLNQRVVVAQRPIETGEEIETSYVAAHFMTKKERQFELEDKWG
eukprot:684378_1